MEQSRGHQVSLRGASAKEISRDDLLERVYHERELRSYARRASSSAIFIQRVWRRYSLVKKEAEWIREQWESTVADAIHDERKNASWISTSLLRPFLFFFCCLSVRRGMISLRHAVCVKNCLNVLIRSVNSTESRYNFCSLVIGTDEERRTWGHQSRKLITLCAFILSKCVKSDQDIVSLTALSMRFLVTLTDAKAWKFHAGNLTTEAYVAFGNLVKYMGSRESGFYVAAREYIKKLDVNFSNEKSFGAKDNMFLITASTVTLAIRPFQSMESEMLDQEQWDLQTAPAQFLLLLLTIPWFCLRMPVALMAALRHKSVLLPCFRTFLVLGNDLLIEMDRMIINLRSEVVPPVGWALANVICMVAGNMIEYLDSGSDCALYVRSVTILCDNFLARFTESDELARFGGEDVNLDPLSASKASYIQLLSPVSEQSHLLKLVDVWKACHGSSGKVSRLEGDTSNHRNMTIVDIAYFYTGMINICSVLNPNVGSLPVLNVLAFCPGYVTTLWEELETYFFPVLLLNNNVTVARNNIDTLSTKKQKQTTKEGSKLAVVLNKMTGKAQGTSSRNSSESSQSSLLSNHTYWDVENLVVSNIPREIWCLVHQFCYTYAHLLLILDDIEFYEKQVPFALEKQQRIASVLNTLVYHGATNTLNIETKTVIDSVVRCLHLLYERDCRRPFCQPDLWLSPAKKNRLPIATAARIHERYSAPASSSDGSTQNILSPQIASHFSAASHVYPFEERVQMFRELINIDKASRRMAGEVAGPGTRGIEIVVRRDHIFEDGFRQLNFLGSRLKSSIHVSFVSESGLPEAGLDYGGLSKEFLTDIAKTAFSPGCGLFVQCSTSERLLVPNPGARHLDNGIQMFEFLGRIVGKALYEGFLLDYSFSHVFVQKLLGRYSFLDELSTLDPELYKNLMYVKHYEGDVEELSLDFTVVDESSGIRQIVELKSRGKDVAVSNENKMQYIHAMADYKLNRQILPFSNAFYRGLTDLISPSWLKLFNAKEFNQLLSGGELDIDVDDLRNHTKYSNGYSESSRTIKLFWEVVKGFQAKERCLLLKFVTSCSRAPLLGFKYLQPAFTIHKVSGDSSSLWSAIGGADVERLPSASTCYNTLKLPAYKRASTMRAKLLYAVNSNAGFELS